MVGFRHQAEVHIRRIVVVQLYDMFLEETIDAFSKEGALGDHH